MCPRSRDSRSDARNYALKLLGYRSRSVKELKDRLTRKGFSDGEIARVIDSFQSAGLLNEEDLAQELLRNAVEKRYFGKRAVEQFLLQRGLGKELVREHVSALSGDKEKETAARFVERKARVLQRYPVDVVRRKLLGMLRRRGFSHDAITSALGSIGKET